NKKPQKGDPLTPTEQIVLEHCASGKTPQQIADTLVCAKRTVDFHKGRIFIKLGVHSVLSMLNEARANNLIPLDALDGKKPPFKLTELQIRTIGLVAEGKTSEA